MRRKIAKRRRRDILALGGVIEKEEWYGPKTMPRKEKGYSVHVRHKEWTIFAAGEDELDAYQLAIWCMKYPKDEFELTDKENI